MAAIKSDSVGCLVAQRCRFRPSDARWPEPQRQKTQDATPSRPVKSGLPLAAPPVALASKDTACLPACRAFCFRRYFSTCVRWHPRARGATTQAGRQARPANSVKALSAVQPPTLGARGRPDRSPLLVCCRCIICCAVNHIHTRRGYRIDNGLRTYDSERRQAEAKYSDPSIYRDYNKFRFSHRIKRKKTKKKKQRRKTHYTDPSSVINARRFRNSLWGPRTGGAHRS